MDSRNLSDGLIRLIIEYNSGFSRAAIDSSTTSELSMLLSAFHSYIRTEYEDLPDGKKLHKLKANIKYKFK